MADNEVKFKLDLDTAEFVNNAGEALNAITEVGNPESLKGLVSTLKTVGISLGAVAAAAYAFKTAIDLTAEAEKIQQTTNAFQTLTAQAGISASALNEGLEKASKGLLDNNDLMASANAAIVKMGNSAKRLPEIMELARKSTEVFGGDLKTNFDNMTTAIANGNTRMLKQYGIIVDSTKAVQDYAKANGLAADEVSEAGKRQAIMNAALEQGQERFKGIAGNLGETQTLVQQLGVTFNDMKDIFLLVFEKTIGPALHNFLGTVNDVAGKVKTALQSMFGEGIEKNNAQIKQAESLLASLKAKADELQKDNGEQGFLSKLWNGDKASQIADVNHQIAQTTAMLNVLKQTNSQLKEQDDQSEASLQKKMAAGAADASQDIVNQDKRLANRAKFQAELMAMDSAYYKEKTKNINSLTELDEIADQQSVALAQQHQVKIAAINQSESTNAKQKQSLLHLENARYTQASIANEKEVANLRIKLLNDYVSNSTSSFDGISRAARQMTLQAKAELKDFGKQGTEIMNSFRQNSVSAFQTMGAAMAAGTNIAQATTTAIKNLFLGMIGDIAIQDGTRMLLSGIFPPNPLAIAGGAALIAFGGAMKSLSGGSATTTSTGAVSASTVSATNNGVTETQSPTGPVAAANTQTSPQRVVSVNIAGNYFDTDTTRRQLMEMIRQETDATNFQYNSIGV